MSDMTFTVHTRVCDWLGCDQTFDPDHGGEWLHVDGRDYCSKHWHIDDDLDERIPGPDPKPPVPVEEQERFQKVFRKYHDRHRVGGSGEEQS